MPNTTSANWPTLTAGQVARASDVEAKFDWSEYHLWPHALGNSTDNTFDLGNTATAAWRTLYAYSINATSTARGLAIGTTTVANNSSTALEIAGTRAVLLPRLSTVQRNNLTAAEGMVLYNSTSTQFQMYQNGAWTAMGGGPSIGIFAKVSVNQVSAATVTVVSIGTGVSGRLSGATVRGAAGTSPILTMIADSFTTGEITATGVSTTAQYVILDITPTTGLINFTTASAMLDMDFRDQLKVYLRSAATSTIDLIYARSA